MSRTKKVIHQNKSKAELIADLQKNAKWVAKMKFAKEVFYPAILELDESISETKSFIASINGIMMEKFLDKMRKTQFKELELEKVLDPKDPKYDRYVNLLNIFSEHSVFDAKDLIEGMKSEIDLFLQDEMDNRKIDTLKPMWLDQLK